MKLKKTKFKIFFKKEPKKPKWPIRKNKGLVKTKPKNAGLS